MWKTGITSTGDLLELAPHFGITNLKVFNKDTVPLSVLRQKQYAIIINIDKQTGDGTHWTCIRKTNDYIYYFDSYGFAPPEKLTKQLRQVKPKKIINFYNSSTIQPVKSNRCGFYCLMALAYNRVSKNPGEFNDLIDKFSSNTKTMQNDDILMKMLNSAALVNKKGGNLLDFAINNLPFEIHVPQLNPKTNTVEISNFIGPGTQLFTGKKRLNPDGTPKPWSKPKTNLDEAAYKHDLAYEYKGKDSNEVRKNADRAFVEEANTVAHDKNEHAFNRLTAYITKNIIGSIAKNR